MFYCMSKVNRSEDKEFTIVRLLPPARPLLPRAKSPLRTIFNSEFQPLPTFQTCDSQQKLNDAEQFGPPLRREPEHGYLVYERNMSEMWNFSPAKVVGTGQSHYSSNEKTLQFHSNFESGNLKKAYKIAKRDEYNLTLQRDINTYGYTQWFFFKVCNSVANKTCRFNITNFYKKKSLFTKGMKVLVYSFKDSSKGWQRSGSSINYYKNNTVQKYAECKPKQMHTLTFEYTFAHNDDTVYFACNYPYTYSDLRKYIEEKEINHKTIVQKNTICRTLAGNRVQVLTLTNPSEIDNKKVIVITARLHPGQTVSSFIAKGMIDYLSSQQNVAKILRDKFIFKIIPMMNPDGVIHGNYRTSLSGRDLNRRWQKTCRDFEPEIYYIKQYIRQLQEKSEIILVCDLHGHSTKKSVFAYACQDNTNKFRTRELPFILSKMSRSFNFRSCTFGIDASKSSTLRAFFWRQVQVPDVLTVETSLCGPEHQNNHFTLQNLEILGQKICESIHVYFEPTHKNQLIQQLYSQTFFDNQDSDSDSDPDQFQMSVATLKKLQRGRLVLIEPKISTSTLEISIEKQQNIEVQSLSNSKRKNKSNCFRQTQKIFKGQKTMRQTFFMNKRFKTQQSVPKLRLDEDLQDGSGTFPKFLRKQSFAKSIYAGFNKYSRVRSKYEQGIFQNSSQSVSSHHGIRINQSVISSQQKEAKQVLLIQYQDAQRHRIRKILRNR